MAGFQLTLHGRFWVITEAHQTERAKQWEIESREKEHQRIQMSEQGCPLQVQKLQTEGEDERVGIRG